LLFEDLFDEDITGWVTLPEQEKVDGGVFVVKTEPGKKITNLMSTFLFDQETMCIEVDVESTVDVPADAGVAFWGENQRNFYWFVIGKNTDGEFETALFRQLDGEADLIFVEKSASFEVGPGKVNTIQVDIDGTIISFSVNGEPVKKTRAQAPDKKFRIGLIAQTAAAKKGENGVQAFHSMKVTNPDE